MSPTCIIIEDEKAASRRLSKMLQKQQVQVLDCLYSVDESIQWFTQNPEPDLIFLDIQLGDGLSFEIFEVVQPKSKIIFTTAYDEYAIKAFKHNSIDYLLKPITEKDLLFSLEKFHQLTQENKEWNQVLTHIFPSQKYKERFLIEVGQTYKIIVVRDVSAIISENKSTYLIHDRRQYPIAYSLDEIEQQLNPKDFFRINRKCIVNISFISNAKVYPGNRIALQIQGLEENEIVSRERVSLFKLWIKGEDIH